MLIEGADGALYDTASYGELQDVDTAFQLSTAASLVMLSTPAPILYGTPLVEPSGEASAILLVLLRDVVPSWPM